MAASALEEWVNLHLSPPIQTFDRLKDAHPHRGGEGISSLSLLIQMLITSRNNFTDTLRKKNVSRAIWSIQSSCHIKLTITIFTYTYQQVYGKLHFWKGITSLTLRYTRHHFQECFNMICVLWFCSYCFWACIIVGFLSSIRFSLWILFKFTIIQLFTKLSWRCLFHDS